MQVDSEPPHLLIKPEVREEEFYALAGEDGDWEYLDGRLVMSPASDLHEDLFRFLMTLLSVVVDARGAGVVRGSRYPMRLDERWSPEPDLLFVREERRHLLAAQRLEGPADFVIEIASESDPQFEIREKIPRYLQAAVPEIWLVHPFDRTVYLWIDGQARSLSSGRLESKVVPGFWIEVDWLWQQALPSTLTCLREILG
ncbi:MAG TPA: Uma2 family endonuclease [Thermoanaerobaculia bacterium]